MSYARSAALQAAAYAALAGSAEVSALVGDRVYDSPPHADGPEASVGPWLTLGEERVEPWTAQGLEGAVHELEIAIHGGTDGFAEAKRIAAAAAAALESLPPLTVGRIVTADFAGARARRLKDGRRRIDLRFRYRVEG